MDIVTIKSGKDLIKQFDESSKPRQVFGSLLYENELGILFGDSSTGKSILANDIGFLASGGGIPWEGMESIYVPTLYVDMEMTERQFVSRYHNIGNHMTDMYSRAEVNTYSTTDSNILSAIKTRIIIEQASRHAPKFIIIDNITKGFGSIMSQSKMKNLIFEMKNLKERFGLTILLIAHCPKRKPNTPITQDSLGGSKMIINFVDSAIAISPSVQGNNIRYLKQTKTREDETMNDVVTIKITTEPYLHFEKIGYANEIDHIDPKSHYADVYFNLSPEKEIQLIKYLSEGKRISDISFILGIPENFVFDYASKNQLL